MGHQMSFWGVRPIVGAVSLCPLSHVRQANGRDVQRGKVFGNGIEEQKVPMTDEIVDMRTSGRNLKSTTKAGI